LSLTGELAPIPANWRADGDYPAEVGHGRRPPSPTMPSVTKADQMASQPRPIAGIALAGRC